VAKRSLRRIFAGLWRSHRAPCDPDRHHCERSSNSSADDKRQTKVLHSASVQTCRTSARATARAMGVTRHQEEVLSSTSVRKCLLLARETAKSMRTTKRQAEVIYSASTQRCHTTARRSNSNTAFKHQTEAQRSFPYKQALSRPLRDNKGASKLWLL
jgi:hypothetical protein